MKSLSGKVALITGAGRGIGRNIAQCLAESGVKVAVNYAHSEHGAFELVQQLQAGGMEAVAFKADVSSTSDIKRMVDDTINSFGQLDILVNNAAIDPTEDFFQVTESFWERVVHTNLKGTFFCAQACAEVMCRNGKGRIINISSVHGHLTMPNYSVYASTKGAINALTRQLAIDLAKFGITVNAVAPGAIEVEKIIGQPWYDREEFGKYIPMGRIGQPRDVSAIVKFLATDEAEFITGQIITVDGGSSAKLFLPIDVKQD